MVTYGDSRGTTPSLRKYDRPATTIMERRRKSPSFSIGHILGDPFALATISLSVLAWLIALVGGIISQIQKSYVATPGNPGGNYPNFLWWTTAYMFCVIVGVITVVASGSPEIYQGAIVGFLAIAFVYSTSAVSSLVYQVGREEEAAAAGFILISIIIAVWLFYFGSNPQTPTRSLVDSYALQKEHRASMMGPGALGTSRPISNALNPGYPRPAQTPSQVPQMYTSNQLTGFENSSPVSGYPGGPVGASRTMSPSGPRSPGLNGGFSAPPPQSAPVQQQDTTSQYMSAPPPMGAGPGGDGAVEYPYRAKAIYSYDANPTDPNEISFVKHEILEVSDVSGRWWQAKKENGETGIAPSNYLILM